MGKTISEISFPIKWIFISFTDFSIFNIHKAKANHNEPNCICNFALQYRILWTKAFVEVLKNVFVIITVILF